ncbi:MAG: 3-dehydroquinate synthase [Pseudomonadota bacterium]
MLTVDLGDRSYPIYIQAGALSDSDLYRKHLSGSQAIVVTNERVAPLYLEQLKNALDPATQVSTVVLPDGEEHKSLAVLEQIYDVALKDGHNRTTTILALGGGVVGDMAGFAAASYQRGVPFIQIPTTLLAQVDSSVGGKTGVNHPLGKNMIGAFYQPQAVLIDTKVLASLPPREYAAGLAEVIKYGLICDQEFYDWLQARSESLAARDSVVLEEAIERSCDCKARVVAADEKEAGLRAILNLGHTFAHAIESAQGYGVWLHGEAVAAGMVLALRLSISKGYLDATALAPLLEWLRAVNLPVEPPQDIAVERWLELMRRDKKAVNGKLRLVLLRRIGEAFLTDEVSEEELRAFLGEHATAGIAE